MEEKRISANDYKFKERKSYSPAEVIAAGGADAFAIKMGISTERLLERQKKLPAPEPMTKEEWAELHKQIANENNDPFA